MMGLQKPEQLRWEALNRLRWRLRFVFAESKYPQFLYVTRGGKVNPHFKNIDDYCLRHWGKMINEMSEKELSERISIVSKWKLI